MTNPTTPAKPKSTCKKHDWDWLFPFADEIQGDKLCYQVHLGLTGYKVHKSVVCLNCGKTGYPIYGRRYRVNPPECHAILLKRYRDFADQFGFTPRQFPGTQVASTNAFNPIDREQSR